MTALDVRPATPVAARGGTLVVYRWETAKLVRQVRTRLVALACVVAPFLFAAALEIQTTTPQDTLFGRWVHDSGFAVPLVVLGFAGQWALPALTSVVAGDIFAGEDRHGTWRTILTRSRSRAQVFAGKTLAALTYAVVVTVLLGASSLLAGVLVVGRQPLVGLSGTLIGPGHATALVLAAWASALPPVLAFTGLGLLLSVAGRNGALGIGGPVVIGLVMQLAAMVDLPVPVRTLLLSTPFAAWHGLFADPPFRGPLLWGALVSAAYLLVSVGGAYALLRRRDITGG